MKYILSILLFATIGVHAQPTSSQWNWFLKTYQADTAFKGKAIRDLQAANASLIGRATKDSNIIAAIAAQVTDSAKAATVIGRVKAIEAYNKKTAIFPDTASFTITGNTFSAKPPNFTAVKLAIEEITKAVGTLSETVGSNKKLFDELKARIDNLKLIFTIQ